MTEAELSAALEKAETERDELTAKVEKAEAERDELSAKVEKLEAAKPDVEPEAINKDELDPRIREALEKAEKRAEEADARIEKAEKLAKAEADLRVTREFVAKAQAFAHVAGDADEFGPVLKHAAEMLSKEDYELLEQRLTAANEQIDKGDLFTQAGHSGDGERGDGAGEVARKADELRKSDPSISRFDAMRQAARGEDGARYLESVR